MLSSRSIDVLVVGAGPAGSATARRLAQEGWKVLLLDRADFPRSKPCSEYLGPGAVRELEDLGALATLPAARVSPLAGTTVVGAAGARMTGIFGLADPASPEITGVSIERTVLDQALVHHAVSGGAEFSPRSTVEDLLYEGGAVGGAVVRDRDGLRHAVHARLTIGADGLRSVVARRLGGMRHGRPRRLGFVGHVRGVAGLGTTAEMHVGPAGYVGINPLAGGLANVALVVPADRAGAAAAGKEQFFFNALESFPGVRGRVPRSGLEGEVMVTGPFSARARKVSAPGALLVGDAADFFDPFTGEGIFSALKGASLATQVAHHALQVTSTRLGSLEAYRGLRRRAFAGKWAVERLVGYGMLAPRLFDRAVARIERRGLSHTFVGVTGDFLPASRVLNPPVLARMIL